MAEWADLAATSIPGIGRKPARFTKMAAVTESSDDEFGILEDDRCIDTCCFKHAAFCTSQYLLAANPLPRQPQISHTILTQANWCALRTTARCKLGVLPIARTLERGRARDLMSSLVSQLVLNEPLVCLSQPVCNNHARGFREEGLLGASVAFRPIPKVANYPRCRGCDQTNSGERSTAPRSLPAREPLNKFCWITCRKPAGQCSVGSEQRRDRCRRRCLIQPRFNFAHCPYPENEDNF